jgi:phospholipid/cholesterol/gamma-HCH transport system substrate-binding protein
LWRNLRTGILFVAGIALMAVLALVIGKNTSALSSKTTYKMFVLDIAGLAENNLVAVAGKKVGTVTTLDFASPNDTTIGIDITMSINQEFAYLFREGSTATITGQGVLGDKFIEVVPGRGATLKPDTYLKYETSGGLDAVLTAANHTSIA